MNACRFTMVASLAMACAPKATNPPTEAPGGDEAPPPSAADEPEASPEAAVGEPEAPVVDEPVGEVPVVEGQWRPLLPAISTEALDEAEVQKATECAETHRLMEMDAKKSAGELMAATECLRDARDYGKEVAIHRLILAQYADDPLAVDAMRTMGLRFEQMDNRSGALDTFEEYVQRYPKQKDARALGLRSVCLARSLEDSRREEQMLGVLQKKYGKKGFSRPKPEQLPALCGETEAQ